MIGGQRAELRGEFRAARVGQLVRVQLDAQSGIRCRTEQLRDLRCAECDRLAVGVDRVGQFVLRNFGQQLGDDEIDVGVGASGVFRRHGVRGQQSRSHVDARAHSQVTGDAEHLEFGRRVEPVAGLDLHRRDAGAGQPAQPPECAVVELVEIGRAGRTHRR